ncbi:hypothetical protein FAM6165_02782 [Lacticaseibacillus paracasei]|nr:hypothetical protein FAM6165_02782 [Lacticaseibacillus paracasei]
MIRIVYAMMTGGVTYQELKKATACKNTLVPQTVLVQIFLADLILVYWVPRNEGLRA